MSIPVLVTMLSGKRAKFVAPNQTPVMVVATYTTRGQLNKDGTIYCPADSPVQGHFINLERVLDIKLIEE